MLIAVFKPKADANGEGHEVWGTLRQKEVTRDQLATHLDDGWFESAADALIEAELVDLGKENRSLATQVQANGTIEQLKAKHSEEMDALRAQFDASWSAKLSEVEQINAQWEEKLDGMQAEYESRLRAQASGQAPAASEAPKVDGRSREARAAKATTLAAPE